VRRPSIVALAGILALVLIAGSPQRLVGDGREYLAQAINFASLHGPALRPADIDDVQAEMSRFDSSLAGWNIRGATIADSHRNRDFQHFWFYALLATPGIWITRLLHLPPTIAFTGLNLVLLGIALWVALPRIGAAASVLLFASPIVWWIDKAHTEMFTFALLVIAFALLEEQPWWSIVAAGAAAIQNPPIAAVMFLVCVAIVLRNRSAVTDRRVIAGAAAGILLALLHPVYTFMHHGTPSLLLSATRSRMTSVASLSAVVSDPTVGLVGNFPMLLLVFAAAAFALLRRGSRRLLSPATGVAIASAAVFLFSFSRTTNIHHGGTPSLSRYAIWLIPLVVPFLAGMERTGSTRWRWFLWTAALTSAAISLVAFHPSVPQNSREPTTLATFLWTRHPAWNNPLPEVFSETELHVDDLWIPASTRGCEKILVGGSDEAGWPVPCYPAPIPDTCGRAAAMCYANLARDRYEFTRAPGAAVGKLRTDAVWPDEAVLHVRRIYDAWDWRTLDFSARDLRVVQEAAGVSAVPIGSDDRYMLVLRDTKPDAVLRLQARRQMSGVLMDAMTGRTLATESCDAAEACTIDVPAGFSMLILAMR